MSMINTISQLDLHDLYRVLYMQAEGRRAFVFQAQDRSSA